MRRPCLDCRTLTAGTSRCPDCSAARERNRSASRDAYRDGWKALSESLRRTYPWCWHCGEDRVPLETDHIVPVQSGGESTLKNAQVLCRVCHLFKTTAEGRGEVVPAATAHRPAVVDEPWKAGIA